MLANAITRTISTVKIVDEAQSPRRPGVREEHQAECEEIMKTSVRDHDKLKRRTALLKAHPEKRLRLDTASLKGIARFSEMVCHPECSVGRDEAVAGSDIDMALIISKFPISRRQQMEIVEEIRSQGFTAYHPSELSHSDPGYPHKMLELIHFHTYDELQAMYQQSGILKPVIQSYIAGKRVDKDEVVRRCHRPHRGLKKKRKKLGLFHSDSFESGGFPHSSRGRFI